MTSEAGEMIEIVADLKDQVMEMRSISASHSEALLELSGGSHEKHWTPCSSPEEVNWYVRRYERLH